MIYFKRLLLTSLLLVGAIVQQGKPYVCNENTSTKDFIGTVFEDLYEFNQSYEDDLISGSFKPFGAHIGRCGRLPISYDSFIKIVQQSTDKLEKRSVHGEPYGQAVIVPAEQKIIIIGDLHGNVHSLARNIERFKALKFTDEEYKLKQNITVIIMGDLGDRGHYSTETWSLALTFQKQNNPGQVVILQGNHESEGTCFYTYGFADELEAKYNIPKGPNTPGEIKELFSWLPQVFFVGTRTKNQAVPFVQICHAGIGTSKSMQIDISRYSRITIPIYINPMPLLQETYISRASDGTPHYQVFSDSEQNTGFTWNDFHTERYPNCINDKTEVGFMGARGTWFSFYAKGLLTYLQGQPQPYLENQEKEELLSSIPGARMPILKQGEEFGVCGIIRGHTHLAGGVNQLKYNPDREISACTNNSQTDWAPLPSQEAVTINPIDIRVVDGDSFPVYTVTSAPELCGSDAFCVLEFNDQAEKWIITPYTFAVPTTVSKKANLGPADPGRFQWTAQLHEEGECLGGVRWKVTQKQVEPVEQVIPVSVQLPKQTVTVTVTVGDAIKRALEISGYEEQSAEAAGQWLQLMDARLNDVMQREVMDKPAGRHAILNVVKNMYRSGNAAIGRKLLVAYFDICKKSTQPQALKQEAEDKLCNQDDLAPKASRFLQIDMKYIK